MVGRRLCGVILAYKHPSLEATSSKFHHFQVYQTETPDRTPQTDQMILQVLLSQIELQQEYNS